MLDATYLLGEKIYVLGIVVNLEFLTGRQAWIVDVVNLLVKAIPHDQCIGQRESVRFHRVSFLSIAYGQVQGGCAEHGTTVKRHYPIVMFADTFGEIIGHNRTRMWL